jgi:hypothetical protein
MERLGGQNRFSCRVLSAFASSPAYLDVRSVLLFQNLVEVAIYKFLPRGNVPPGQLVGTELFLLAAVRFFFQVVAKP